MFFNVTGTFANEPRAAGATNRDEGEDWRTACVWALGVTLPWISLAGMAVWIYS